MKFQASLFILFSFFHGILFSQSCLPEGITFNYQEEIDSFQVNYPGCTTIEGSVIIWGYDIEDLCGLNTITHIGGRLFIHYNEFHNLSGLENLDTIEGDLLIKSNMNLTSLEGLEGLSCIGGDFDIFNNPDLKDLSGLQGLTHVGGFFSIALTDSLKYCTGLENLTAIGGDLVLSSNKGLEGLDGLENIMSIGGYLKIYFNPLLTSISSLQNLDPNSVSSLYLYENHSLSICNELVICYYLTSPPGSLNIYNNAQGCNNPSEIASSCGITLSCHPYGHYYFLSQNDIDNFQTNYPNCTELQGNVYISETDATNLSGLNIVTSISGKLEIFMNDTLPNLSGLENLHYIGGDFEIIGNASMTSTHGIEYLDSIEGNMDFGGNPVIEDLSGFAGLNYLGGYLLINGNDSLKSLNGLNNLQKIDGGLIIEYAFSLKDLQGLNNLDTIREGIGLWWNDSLKSLAGLENVKLARAISIEGNNLLTSLSGLDNINPDSINWLKISYNDNLSECDINSLCEFLATGDTNVDIQFNDAGCFNREEVEAACGVGVGELADDSRQLAVVTYPNPVSSMVTFGFYVQTQSVVVLSVFNSLGQPVANIMKGSLEKGDHQLIWNTQDFPAGIYFYSLSAGRQASVGKIVLIEF